MKWEQEFSKFLADENKPDFKMNARKAISCIVPHAQKYPIKFDDILNPKYVRDMLTTFRNNSSQISTSKLNYLSLFEQFIEWLFLDFTSPHHDELDETTIKIKLVKIKF